MLYVPIQQKYAAPTAFLAWGIYLLQSYRTYGSKKKIIEMSQYNDN